MNWIKNEEEIEECYHIFVLSLYSEREEGELKTIYSNLNF
jgi:hypothetical protein